MLHKYNHTPLEGARSTRVLVLQPAAEKTAPLRCELQPISLDDYPAWQAHYTALSYTWDGQTPSCEVVCNDKGLLITPNCDAAMRHLRSSTEERILWIDSICIDQTEEAEIERNRQVALMGEIYKSAAKVVVWLGESNAAVEGAINNMLEVRQIFDFEGKTENDDERPAKQKALRDHMQSISDSESRRTIRFVQ